MPCLFESRITQESLTSEDEDPSEGQRDVLEPHLAAGDLLPVFSPGDDHLPELLALALDNRLAELDRASNPASADLLEAQAGYPQKLRCVPSAAYPRYRDFMRPPRIL